MSFNILDAVKGYLTPDLISKASSSLGENESGITKALSGIVPSVLSGLIAKATSGGHSGANEVLGMAKETHNSGILGGLSGMFGDGLLSKGTGLLQGLFGDKLNAIVSSIATFAGIKNSSANALFNLAAPVSTAALGKYATENNLDASGFSSFLSSQKNSVMSMLPAGLSGVLGLGSLGSAMSSASGDAKKGAAAVTDYAKETGGSMKWLPWLLLLAGLAVAAWYFLLRDKGTADTNVAVADTTQHATTPPVDTTPPTQPTPVVSGRESMKVKLPDGKELDAYKGGIEDQLVSFLATDWTKLGADSLKKLWFDFDNLNFKTGSADLTAESQQQVDNLTAILKAYPAAKLKIGGYTDKTGNEDNNKKLSTARANAVKAALAKASVGTQVTSAEGYGSQFAKFASDAPESDRVKDRHVSVSVRS